MTRSELLEALLADPARAMALSTSEATTLLAQAGAVEAVLRARLAATNGGLGAAAEPPTLEKPQVRMLTLDDAVQRSRLSRRWFHDNWREALPFGIKKGRTILFPEADFERWLKRP